MTDIMKATAILCWLGIHSWKQENLMYSVLRACTRPGCHKKQYMNMHPARDRIWEDLTPEYEERLRHQSTGGFYA